MVHVHFLTCSWIHKSWEGRGSWSRRWLLWDTYFITRRGALTIRFSFRNYIAMCYYAITHSELHNCFCGLRRNFHFGLRALNTANDCVLQFCLRTDKSEWLWNCFLSDFLLFYYYFFFHFLMNALISPFHFKVARHSTHSTKIITEEFCLLGYCVV